MMNELTRQKISIAKLGKPSPKKGIPTGLIPWNKGKKNPYSEITIKNMSLAKKGKPSLNKGKKFPYKAHTKAIGRKVWNKGKKFSQISGDKHWAWKGGIAPINQTIRGSLEYKLWQDSVKNRDGNCCQKCGDTRTSKIMAHHILNFSKYIELRMAIDNGITFCRDCHKKFHLKYGFKNNSREQVIEFLNK